LRAILESLADILARAESGEAIAQYQLGLLYYQGTEVERDYELAVHWWREAIERGLEEPIFNLAQILEEGGFGLEKDLVQSFYWWLQGARWGKGDLTALACFKVGQAYYEGRFVAQDLIQASLWLEKAEGLGHPEALALLKKVN
jgi:TPR repeat protein